MARVRRTAQASLDLLEIWHSIAAFSVSAADRQFDRLKELLRRMGEIPGIGTAREELLPGLRSVPKDNYVVYFRVKGKTVEILRIVHGARNANTIFPPKM